MVRIKFRIYKSIVKGRKIPELEKLKVRFTSGSESGLLLVIVPTGASGQYRARISLCLVVWYNKNLNKSNTKFSKNWINLFNHTIKELGLKR